MKDSMSLPVRGRLGAMAELIVASFLECRYKVTYNITFEYIDYC